MDDRLSAHGLTGCDTVAIYHGIGKSVTLNVLRSGTLPNVGDMALSVREGLCAINTLYVILLRSSRMFITDRFPSKDIIMVAKKYYVILVLHKDSESSP